MADVERTAESYESSLDWWAEQNGKLRQEVEQLREALREVKCLREAEAFSALKKLVLSEYPSDETLGSIARTWGAEVGLTDDEVAALAKEGGEG